MEKGNLVRWKNSAVEVKADFVPRYLYTTASIDVYVDDNCILRTGGVWRFWGTQSADFMHDGKSHPAELSWRSGNSSFWCELKLDGESVLRAVVVPRNLLTPLIPGALALALVILLAKFIGG